MAGFKELDRVANQVQGPQKRQISQTRDLAQLVLSQVELLEVDALNIHNPLDPVLVQGEYALVGVLFQIFDSLKATEAGDWCGRAGGRLPQRDTYQASSILTEGTQTRHPR